MMCYLFAELPESRYLEFKCGVQIQLGFAAEFSNVMIIYTRIVKKPPEIVVCRAYVTDFALVSASYCCLGDLPPLKLKIVWSIHMELHLL